MFISELSDSFLSHYPIIRRGGDYVQQYTILPLKVYLETHHRLPVEDYELVILMAYVDLLRELPEDREILIGDHSITAIYFAMESHPHYGWLKDLVDDLIHQCYGFISEHIELVITQLYQLYPRNARNPSGFIHLSDIGCVGSQIYLIS